MGVIYLGQIIVDVSSEGGAKLFFLMTAFSKRIRPVKLVKCLRSRIPGLVCVNLTT
jgi:hypothetical protein